MKRILFLVLFLIVGINLFSQTSQSIVDSLNKRGFSLKKETSSNFDNLIDLYKWYIQNDSSMYKDVGLGKRLVPTGVYSVLEEIEKVSKSSWSIGIDFQYPHNAIYLKGGFPITVSDNQYLTLSGFVGKGIGNVRNNNSKMKFSLGINLDYCFLTEDETFNPVITAQLGYLTLDNKKNGFNFLLMLGDQIFLSKKRNFSFSLKGGVALWNEIEYPSSFAISAGLAYHFSISPEEDKSVNLYGKIFTKEIDGLSKVDYNLSRYDLLAGKELHKYEGEIRTYVYEKYTTPTEKYVLKSKNQLFGDLSDIKFLWLDINLLKFVKDMRKESFILTYDEYLDKVKEYYKNRKKVYIAAIFNPRKVNVQSLKHSDLLLHFVDYDNDQYFGYQIDKENNRIPEVLSKQISSESNSHMYYGYYKDFVKKMSWLDEENFSIANLKGSTIYDLIKDDISLKINNYFQMDSRNKTEQNLNRTSLDTFAIAIAEYSLDNIKDMWSFKKGGAFGASIKICKDNNGNGIYKKIDNFTFDVDNDDFVFTNHFKIENIEDIVLNVVNNFELTNFDLGRADIKEHHYEIIRNKLIPAIAGRNDFKLFIEGYTDATPLTAQSEFKTQEELSLARAERIKNFLIDEFKFSNVEIIGKGVAPFSRENYPKDRKVFIRVGFNLDHK